jgi:hypothetical protein
MSNTYSLDLERGSTQYASKTDTASLSITGDLTFEFWAKFESLPGAGDGFTFLSKWQNVGQLSYYLQIVNDGSLKLNLAVSTDGTANETYSLTWTPSTATWYHIAVSWKSSTSKANFYINGVQEGTEQSGALTAIKDGTDDFVIGQRSGGATLYDGLIDDVRVWNDVRTAAEILANYNKELIGTEANLQAYWKLNNSALDETTNDNDLTLTGSPVYSTDVPFVGASGFFAIL